MSKTGPSLVETRHAGRDFPGGTVALLHATCSIYAGDRIAIVGQSGSGKSTLLHLLAGLDVPTSGSVTWPSLGDRAALRPAKIGMVFQSPSLIAWLDVTENVALPLQLTGSDLPAREHALAALRRFEIDHLANKLPEELSGGQAQRISLVRATITNPALLLADEPTGQLDHDTAAKLMDALLSWADEDEVAIVVATHDAGVAARFGCNWHMRGGVLATGQDSSEP